MISNFEQTGIGETGVQVADPVAEAIIQVGLMGIPLADYIIRKNTYSGGVTLVAGGLSGDASILGSQIAARAITRSQRVLYLSTKQEQSSLTESMFSYLADWPHDNLEGGKLVFDEDSDPRIPYDANGDPEFTHRALPFMRRHEQYLDFHLCRDFKGKPLEILEEVLSTAEVPDCLILDELQIAGVVGPARKPVNQGRLAEDVMRRLARYAHENGIPVVVLCQQQPDDLTVTRKRVGTSQIADFPIAGNCCDVFIGISQLRAAANIEVEGSHSSAQYFHVHGWGGIELIPVTIDFSMQRISARDDDDVTEDMDLAMRAAMIARNSEYGAYTMFRRDVFKQLCALRIPKCINLYALCLLVTDRNKGDGYGTMSYGYDKLGMLLGIERRRVKELIGILVKAGLMVGEGKNGRAYKYRMVNYAASQDANEPGYLMLAYNLRDSKRSNLLGDPLLFRVWLGCLFTARFSRDTEFLERGQLMRNSYELAELLGDDPEDVDAAIARLVDEGRMEEVILDFANTSVLEVTNYEIYQNGWFYSKEFAAKMGHFCYAKPVPNACQTRAKWLPNPCQTHATI